MRKKGDWALRTGSDLPSTLLKRTASEVERKILKARRKTGYGRKRLTWWLAREEGLILSPHTMPYLAASGL
jgi:hypothetical protein